MSDKIMHEGKSDWNIAHVRNAINSYGGVPEKHHALSVELLDGLLSTAINDQNSLRRANSALVAVRRCHAAVGVALSHNDPLRVKALIIDWEKEYGFAGYKRAGDL